jgi:hypothetical protein
MTSPPLEEQLVLELESWVVMVGIGYHRRRRHQAGNQ